MLRNCLTGKGQIRRPFAVQPGSGVDVQRSYDDPSEFVCVGTLGEVPKQLRKPFKCPIGNVGDVFAVGERIFYYFHDDRYTYEDGETCTALQRCRPRRRRSVGAKNMPKMAARFHFRIVAVFAHRLGELAEGDAQHEGVDRIEYGPFEVGGVPVHPRTSTYAEAFLEKWAIHVDPGWIKSDWVWAAAIEPVAVRR